MKFTLGLVAVFAVAASARLSTASDIVYWAEPYANAIYNNTQSGPIATVPATVSYSDSDLAVDSLGNMYESYIPGSGPSGVIKIAPDGSSYALLGAVASPGSVAVTPAGEVYVAGAGGISSISQAGVVTPVYSTSSYPALATDHSGDLFIASSGSIIEITPDGTVSTFGSLPTSVPVVIDGYTIPPGQGILSAIGVDPSGNVFVDLVDVFDYSGSGEIFKVTPGGSATLFAAVIPGASPISYGMHGMAVGNNGDVYTDGAVIDPSGNVTVMDYGGGFGIAVLPTPEPSSWILLAIGAVASLAHGLRKRHTRS